MLSLGEGMGLSDRIRGTGATVSHFDFQLDDEAIPIVWECAQPDCPSVAWLNGLAVRRFGFVTCMRCLKPMVRIQATVH